METWQGSREGKRAERVGGAAGGGGVGGEEGRHLDRGFLTQMEESGEAGGSNG